MNKNLIILILMVILLGFTAYASKPQVILGPGVGGANFRVPYHQNFDRTLSSDTVYILSGWYFVDSTYRITIPAGTLLRGDSASAGSLIIKRGAQIFAQGTAARPIIFTSNKPAGTRRPGDWGGVIVLGNSITNQPSNKQVEGGFGTIPNTDAMYGGSDPSDNSGILQYLRIEFAGIAFAQDNEINGLTFGGVGNGTTVDHIQVSYAQDDDYEFFGGTVDAKYLVSWRNLDDTYDSDFGYAGRLQFLYTKRDPLIFDASASGTSNGFESDNEGSSPYSATPRTKVRFSNVTLVGPQNDTSMSVNSKYQYVAMIRRASEASIYNSILMGYPWGIQIKDTLSQRAAIDNRLEIRSTSLQARTNILTLSSSPSTGNIAGFVVKDWFDGASPYTATDNLGSTARNVNDIGLPSAVFNLDATNNPVPQSGSEADTAGTLYQGRLAGDSFFDSVSYRGAFDPSKSRSQQWDGGWSNYDPNNYEPEADVHTVNFQINMKVQMKKGLFATGDSVYVSGGFNGWGSSSDIMSDPDGDSIYTVILLPDTAGKTIEFKFRYKNGADPETWESDPNRAYVLPATPSAYYAWFNNDSIFVQQYDIAFTFSCNMELERLSGRFNPAEDTVSVNGDFNGWSAKTTILNPNPLNPDLYEATKTIRRGLGETIEFKFWYEENNWESVANRKDTISQDEINALAASFSASFNDGSLDNVINQACEITFTVNTNGARSIIDGNPFSSVNTVHIAGSALPLQWPNGGWPTDDSTRMTKLYDDGTNGDAIAGDKIFSGKVTFAAYTPLNVLYKYGINYGDAANNGGGNDNEAGFATNHTLQMTKFMAEATTFDIFGTMGISKLAASRTLTLQTGWNMISLPYIVTDNRKTALYPDAISSAFYYNGTYQAATYIENGVGYWLKSPSEKNITIGALDIMSDTIPVLAGWNMIGSIASPISVSSITSDPSGMITSSFFGFAAGYTSVDTIFPGKGYWVKTSGSGSLILSSSTLVGTVSKHAIKIVPTSELPPSPPEVISSSEKVIPTKFAIENAFPNPFNPTTRFAVDVPRATNVEVAIYNVLGQKIVTLMNGEQAAGSYDMEWNATDAHNQVVPTGIYFVRMTADNFSAVQKIMLMK
jgi:hypothetical protein